MPDLLRPLHRRIARRAEDRRRAQLTAAGYLALAAFAGGSADRWERESFREVNGESGLMPVLRVPQQLGTPWVLPSMALVGFQTHRSHLAVSAALALPVEKALEVGVKKVTVRTRPAKDVPDSELRDDAPTHGPSYPSGHAAIAFAAVTLAAPYLPTLGTAALASAASLATLARVYQGAHFPLDAVGGALLGVAVGSGLNFVFGSP